MLAGYPEPTASRRASPYRDRAGTHRDAGPAAWHGSTRHPPRVHLGPTHAPQPPGRSLGSSAPHPGSTFSPPFCLSTQSLSTGLAGGSSKALPLLNPSIIDIVAEPQGPGGVAAILSASVFIPRSPALPRQAEKPRDQAVESRLQLLSCSLAWGGGESNRPPSRTPCLTAVPSPRLCCSPAARRALGRRVSRVCAWVSPPPRAWGG